MIPCCPKCLCVLYVTDAVMVCPNCGIQLPHTEQILNQLLSTADRKRLVNMREEYKAGKRSESLTDHGDS